MKWAVKYAIPSKCWHSFKKQQVFFYQGCYVVFFLTTKTIKTTKSYKSIVNIFMQKSAYNRLKWQAFFLVIHTTPRNSNSLIIWCRLWSSQSTILLHTCRFWDTVEFYLRVRLKSSIVISLYSKLGSSSFCR